MSLDNNQFEGHGDIAQFLEKFKEQSFSSSVTPAGADFGERLIPSKPSQYERTFEKLEQKIQELEERFEASASQNQMILSELARTREAMERQKDRDIFLEHISQTIANLKASVENLSRVRQEHRVSYPEPDVQRGFDAPSVNPPHTAIYHYQPENYRTAQEEKARQEHEEKERIISSLHQKASQLKAVNSALDREIKKVQQEKMEALKKSAEQAKEILSLRDQLTAAEERFKSFDFEGRIVSIRQEYQQKVDSLETQLQEISDTCMKQVEEIESLRAENVKLHKAAAEKEAALKRLEEKERELQALKEQMTALEADHSRSAQEQLIAFTEKLQSLQTQRDELSVQFESARMELEAVRQEKELLEKNFKELVEKINANDAVIEELKQKIAVLGRQNEDLTQQNVRLTNEKEELARTNGALDARMRAAELEKDSLSAQSASLAREKEALEEQTRVLSAERASLAQNLQAAQTAAEDLTREKAELTARSEELTRQMQELAREKDNLSIRSEELLREKQRFEEQNRALSREKNSLSQNLQDVRRTAEDWAREKAELSSRTEELVREKNALEARAKDLNREKEKLSLRALELQKQAETLAAERQELSKENRQLRNQSAALLAARLVQEKERANKEEMLRKAAPLKPAVPQVPSAPAAPQDPKQPILHSDKAEPKWPVSQTEKEQVPLSEIPVSMNARAKASVVSEADLPEIKVADPVPQHEQLFDGEDFLEKTDSFIGRMKWSIFREDK
ncbi:MAG: hypothetical protein ACI351_05790 [Candidatus Avelusimicrobium sp.]|uniref:hypothetical protein n=1 Tax=Candidatus Avelusimicrobium sp. TaxID=3048833 RepID=UPI003EFD7B89